MKTGSKEDEAVRLKTDEQYMREALKQARKAGKLTEVPIGCVIVREGEIIARGYNRRNTDGSTLAHAELAAIRKACRKAGDWRLEDCTLYVTLEPCPMCAGAIVQARVPRVVYGASDPKAGAVETLFNLLNDSRLNHVCETKGGVLAQECAGMLSEFFQRKRRMGKK